MKKIMMGLGVVAMLAGMASCSGRTQENMTPNGDTVELDGGEVVMNSNDSDTTVIADSPAEAMAQADSNKAQ